LKFQHVISSTYFCNLKSTIIATTQVHPGEKVNIFEGDYIGQCKENKVHKNMCLILNGDGDRAD
jgi:hypothetical protein